MKTTNEMIEVMLAYERGQRIEYTQEGRDLWEEAMPPEWDWVNFDYRIREKVYVPFESAEEFLAAQRKHGNTIKRIEDGMIYQAYVDAKGFLLLKANHERIISLENLFGKYKFADGAPCGKEVPL